LASFPIRELTLQLLFHYHPIMLLAGENISSGV